MASSEETVYHGTWKIIECVSLAGVVQITGIEGTEFVLDENGDVSWQVPDNAEHLPFFNCETYEVCPAAGNEPALLKFIGTYAGHIVEFKVDISDELMLLTYEKCCMMQCEKVAKSPREDDSPYSLLSALEQGYFSDLSIKADSGKEFKVHSTILRLSAPELDWQAEVPPLTGLPEDVLCTTFYFLYAECLPRGLSEVTAQKCSKLLGKMPGFSRLGQLCDTFLENTALTQQIKTLVFDMHSCADHINKLFDGGIEKVDACDESQDDDDDSNESNRTVSLDGTVWTNPAKLCYTVRQAMREEAIAVAKLVIMCDLFAKRRHELSREERHEIMKFVKSRIPIFLKQLLRLLKSVKAHLQALTQPQRSEIAAYIVPEMETILDIIYRFAIETKAALEQAINTSNEKLHEKGDKGKKSSGAGDILGRTLRHALHVKELKKLKDFHERATTSFFHLRQKREHFNMKSQPDKVRSVSQSLVHLSEEFPFFVVRLREITAALDERVTWKEWKYLFKMATSKVSWALAKVQTNRSALQPMVDEVCDIMRSEQFVASLITLGLKSPQNESASESGATDASVTISESNASPTKYAQLSSVQSLCIPPHASKSATAKRALELFKEKTETDMVFEVISIQEAGDIVIDHTEEINECTGAVGGSLPVDKAKEEDKETEIVEIGAHRVLVSARCDWFRRALLSGMKEAIDRKITIHDTQPELFLRFLEALYSGHLDTCNLSVEQLADLMTLCDRYEMDVMKHVCEFELKCHLDEENSLYLLNLADHLNSKELRDSALNYVAEHQDITDSDLYDEMPDHLKDEVQHAIVWQGFAPRSQSGKGGQQGGTSSSVSSLSELDEMIGNMNLQEGCLEASNSSEDLLVVEDSAKLESCVQELLDIIGDTVPREELNRIAIAADYDVNRALNYFFSS